MHHDDTMARLEYLSNPLPEPGSEPPSANVPSASVSNDGIANPEPKLADGTEQNASSVEEGDEPQPRLTDDLDDRPGTGLDQADANSGPQHAEAAESDPGATVVAEDPEHTGVPEANGVSHITELLTECDKNWDTTEAALPAGALPESTKTLSLEVINSMDRDVRRVLEYHGAAEYIARNMDERPWLMPAVDASPQVQRILTAIDQGSGHAHIRHGPMGDDHLYENRVARLEDPAQTDPQQRAAGVDGLDESKQHYCAKESTRIHDPEAFVAAFAGAVKHPDVRQALGAPWDEDVEPRPVAIPIADLLGEDGHESCSGYQLAGEWSEAKKARKDWVKARATGQDLSNIPEPKAERIRTFEGGMIIVRFAGNAVEKRYEITTLYPKPLTDS